MAIKTRVPQAFCIARIHDGLVSEYGTCLYNELVLAQAECRVINHADQQLIQRKGRWQPIEFGRPSFVRNGENH